MGSMNSCGRGSMNGFQGIRKDHIKINIYIWYTALVTIDSFPLKENASCHRLKENAPSQYLQCWPLGVFWLADCSFFFHLDVCHHSLSDSISHSIRASDISHLPRFITAWLSSHIMVGINWPQFSFKRVAGWKVIVV